jgi:hypothetical protein
VLILFIESKAVLLWREQIGVILRRGGNYSVNNLNSPETPMNIYDRANAPTEELIQAARLHHIRATLGGNAIIRDYYKTQYLTGERVTRLLPRPKFTWRRTTANLIREKTKRLRRLISEAFNVL